MGQQRNNSKGFSWDGPGTVATTVGVFFAAQVASGLLIYSVLPILFGWDRQQALMWLQDSILADFIYFVTAGFLTLYFLRRVLTRRKTGFGSIGLNKPALRDPLYAAAAYVAYLSAFLVIGNLLALILSIDAEQEQKIGFQNAEGVLQLSMVFVALVVIPPIVEEILMRGFLYEGLKRRYKKSTAVVLTSAIFAVAHLQWGSDAPLLWIAAVDTFILSLVLIHLKERTGGLAAPIMLHAIKNGIAFTALFIL